MEVIMEMTIDLNFFKHRAGATCFVATAVLVSAGHSVFARVVRLAKSKRYRKHHNSLLFII